MGASQPTGVTDDSVSNASRSFISLSVNFKERDKNLLLLECNYDPFLICRRAQQNRGGKSSPARPQGQSSQPSALSWVCNGPLGKSMKKSKHGVILHTA